MIMEVFNKLVGSFEPETLFLLRSSWLTTKSVNNPYGLAHTQLRLVHLVTRPQPTIPFRSTGHITLTFNHIPQVTHLSEKWQTSCFKFCPNSVRSYSHSQIRLFLWFSEPLKQFNSGWFEKNIYIDRRPWIF